MVAGRRYRRVLWARYRDDIPNQGGDGRCARAPAAENNTNSRGEARRIHAGATPARGGPWRHPAQKSVVDRSGDSRRTAADQSRSRFRNARLRYLSRWPRACARAGAGAFRYRAVGAGVEVTRAREEAVFTRTLKTARKAP